MATSGRTPLVKDTSARKGFEGEPASEDRTKRDERLLARILAENTTEVAYRYRLVPTRAYEFVSPSASAMTGFAPEEYYRDADLAFQRIHPEDRAKLEEMLAHPEMARGPVEMRWTRRDGSVIWTEWRGAVVVGDRGEPVAIEGVVRDVTEEHRARDETRHGAEKAREMERLRELDRLKSRIITTAAQELCTPLTPIKVQLHLMLTRWSGNLHEEQIRALQTVDRNVERLTQIVKDVQDVAALQAGGIPVQKRPTDLAAIAKETLESFRESAAAAGVSLEADVAPEMRVNGDVGRLTQVMFNLVSNAIRYTPKGGRVTIEAKPADTTALVRVRDTGVGLRVEDVPRLFQPFVQLKDAVEMGKAGTGVGLYIARGIVEEHGGRIWCESPGPNLGATFSFSLPLLVG